MTNAPGISWAQLGFSEESTGGGCTALIRHFGDGYIMVTEAGTADAPTNWSETVTIGFYASDDFGAFSPFGDFELWHGQQLYAMVQLAKALNEWN